MTHCVNDSSEGHVLFKGRWLCFACYDHAISEISKVLTDKESREKKTLGENDVVRINAPKRVIDEFQRVSRMRGTSFNISKSELGKIAKESKIA